MQIMKFTKSHQQCILSERQQHVPLFIMAGGTDVKKTPKIDFAFMTLLKVMRTKNWSKITV